MNVKVALKLAFPPTEMDIDKASVSAKHLTNKPLDVDVYIDDDHPNTIIAEFTVNRAAQIDIVDGIGNVFRNGVPNYCDQTISFPIMRFRTGQKPTHRYTPKQGQYLAFIYYYTKLNGRPPAEADLQRYFKTTPPTVHNMVVQLEKKTLIEKKPNEPRSIKCLLSRTELPDLE